MKIYLYLNKQIKVFYLPETVSGSFSFDVDEQEVSKLINIDARDDKWYLFETDDCKVLDGIQYVKDTLLEPYKFYVITRNKVNYLINNDINSTSTKNTKAKELGIKIISEEDLLEMVNSMKRE